MITPDIAIRDVLIGYRSRPRVASRFGYRSGGGSIHHYLTTLHARLYGPAAAPGPLPSDLDELRLWALTAGEHAQEAVLAHLATQLPRVAQLLQHARTEPSWPGPDHAWMRDADGALRHLADQIHHLSPAFALPPAPTARTAPPTAVLGPDPAPQDVTRALADFFSPDVAPDDVLLNFRPHPRTGERFTAREAPATAFGSLLHARLHGPDTAASAQQAPSEGQNRPPRATAAQQTAALVRLSGQLHSAGDILTWAQHWSHWRQLPRGVHAQLGRTATTVRELANGTGQIPAPTHHALAAQPTVVPPVVLSPAAPRR
ncbi:hypothetical protein ACFWPU_09885 [Streptomyces sp. NPDC058471]|uniref:hypothetical protein n=1 Tax=Streptomyces sp. NPDC058471 TaxID=3346516 RepID=UPI003649DD25